MGFGHRIYRVRDPRADALKAVVRQLGGEGETGRRLAFAEAVEQTALECCASAKPHRSLQTNVEFYTALLLEAAGLPAAGLQQRLRRRAASPAGSPMPASSRRPAG